MDVSCLLTHCLFFSLNLPSSECSWAGSSECPWGKPSVVFYVCVLGSRRDWHGCVVFADRVPPFLFYSSSLYLPSWESPWGEPRCGVLRWVCVCVCWRWEERGVWSCTMIGSQ
jgi:hypothetical protein